MKNGIRLAAGLEVTGGADGVGDAQVVEVAARRSPCGSYQGLHGQDASVMRMMAPMIEPAITTSHRPALMPMLCWNSSLTSPIAKPAP